MKADYFLTSFAAASVIRYVYCILINYLDFYISRRFLLSIRSDNWRSFISYFQMLFLTQIKKKINNTTIIYYCKGINY